MEKGETVKRELPARGRDWEFWAAVIWTVLFIVWMYYISRCFPNYSVEPSQTVRFSELMAAQGRPDSLIYNPLIVFFVFNVGTIGLAILTELRWLLLTLLANPVVCLILVTSVFCTGFTQLSHLESVEFEGHTYHLTRITAGDWDISFDSLQLYECDA